MIVILCLLHALVLGLVLAKLGFTPFKDKGNRLFKKLLDKVWSCKLFGSLKNVIKDNSLLKEVEIQYLQVYQDFLHETQKFLPSSQIMLNNAFLDL